MNFYICAFSLFLLRTEAACPSTSGIVWTELGDNCYHVSREAMDWGIAQEYCWGIGSYLAEIMAAEEETLLDTFLIKGTQYWLGLSDLSHEGAELVFVVIFSFHFLLRNL